MNTSVALLGIICLWKKKKFRTTDKYCLNETVAERKIDFYPSQQSCIKARHVPSRA